MSLPMAASNNVARVNRAFNFCKDWLSLLAKNNLSFLDIGAGTSVFSFKLVDLTSGIEFQYLAIEPDYMASKQLRSLRKFDVFEGVYDGQSCIEEFSFITMKKVLEHIQEPMKVLKKIPQSIMGRNSVLYLDDPVRLTAEIASKDDNILGSLHCHLYDFRTFACMVEELHLEILAIEEIEELIGKFTIFAFLTSHENLIAKWSCHDH
jgi:hypothetical protein